MKLCVRLLLLAFIALPFVLSFTDPGRVFARAEDPIEDDVIDDEEEGQVTGGEVEAGEEEEGGEEVDKKQGSNDIDVTILFTNPQGPGTELPAGKLVEFLMGVYNSGDREFVIDTGEASFRYPMDFNYYIQNFTVVPYNKVVKPQQEATVMYSFYPAEVFAGRPLGLQINLAYHDADGEDFVEAIFNSTVNIVEIDEGLEVETFFLYVFLLAFSVLLLVVGHTVLTSLGITVGKKGGSKKQHQNSIEIGTNNKHGVDYDWLPDQLKVELKKKEIQAAAAAANGSAKKGQTTAPPNKGSVASNSPRTPATRHSARLRKT
uniref:Translocon-associated protein subunit alpha n=1 Tax=Hirondellea gigas TaxID=1518452 RepID=A0A2P2HXY3_9CRUS